MDVPDVSVGFSVACRQTFAPVTALQCVKLVDKSFFLCGVDCMLKVLTEDGTLYCQYPVFPSSTRIHGFRQWTTTDSVVFVAFGQRMFKVLLISSEDHVSVTELSSNYLESDWILDVQWINYKCSSKHFSLVLIFAHNYAVIFNSLDQSRTVVHSDVNCILYSAQLKYCEFNDELLIASGTVFNDVLIWSHQLAAQITTEPVNTSLVLKGHQGVIFGVNFSNDLDKIVTVSDDRSVRIWSIPLHWKDMRHHPVSCSKVFYGHTARVWSAEWLSQSEIISVSEDTTCRLWDIEKGCVRVITGHKGRNIWSLAVDRDNGIVVTGGGDCAIRRFSYKNKTKPEDFTADLPLPSATDSKVLSPRSLCLLKGDWLLCLTDDGTILEASVSQSLSSSLNSSGWKVLLKDHKYSNYAVMSLANQLPLLALGSLDGHIKLFRTVEAQAEYEWQPYKGKVYSLSWLIKNEDGCCLSEQPNTDLLLSCGPEGEMIGWRVSLVNSQSSCISVEPFCCLILPLSKHHWITSAIYLSLDSLQQHSYQDPFPSISDPSVHVGESIGCIVCGDRKGSVFLYITDPSKEHKTLNPPDQSYFGIHGSNGVTNICHWKGSIYSTGRDGYCRQYIIRQDKHGGGQTEGWRLVEINKFHPVKGVDWIEGTVFTRNNGLITTAFHGSDCIIHSNDLGKIIVSFKCGGGHRSLAMSSITEIIQSQKVVFCYIKGSNVYTIHSDISSELVKLVLQEPFLGREAVSLCELGRDINGSLLVAVGSDDCTIAMVSVNPKHPLTVVKRLEEHTSSVKALNCVPSIQGEETSLLFSGGGRGSMKAWCIHRGIPGLPVSLCCEQNIHNLPSRPQRRKKRVPDVPPESRVMSLTSFRLTEVLGKESLEEQQEMVCVIAGCSDGFIRIYIYSELERSFKRVEDIGYHRRCVLSIKHIVCHMTHCNESSTNGHCSNIILCTAATDGNIAVWNLGRILFENGYFCNTCMSPGDTDLICNNLEEPKPVKPVFCFDKAHQSGINDISLLNTPLNDNSLSSLLTVASVGDDNALVVNQCTVISSSDLGIYGLVIKPVERVLVSSAHHSAITGCTFISSSYLLTSSIDQRLTLWNINVLNMNGKEEGVLKRTMFETKKTCLHSVQDASSLLVHHLSNGFHGAIICGVGMQHIVFNLEQQDSI